MWEIWVKAVEPASLVHGAAENSFSAGIGDPERIFAKVANVFATAVKSQHRDKADFRRTGVEGIVKGELMGCRDGNVNGTDPNSVNVCAANARNRVGQYWVECLEVR